MWFFLDSLSVKCTGLIDRNVSKETSSFFMLVLYLLEEATLYNLPFAGSIYKLLELAVVLSLFPGKNNLPKESICTGNEPDLVD